VTNEDYLPVVEIDDTYPKEMLSDFHWFYKIAFAWKDLKWFKDDLEKSTNSSISFRAKLIQAVTQMQVSGRNGSVPATRGTAAIAQQRRTLIV